MTTDLVFGGFNPRLRKKTRWMRPLAFVPVLYPHVQKLVVTVQLNFERELVSWILGAVGVLGPALMARFLGAARVQDRTNQPQEPGSADSATEQALEQAWV